MISFYSTFYILIFFSTFLIGQSFTKVIKDSSKAINSINILEGEEGEVIIGDGTNQLIRITDEGSFGAIEITNGIPFTTTNKLYNNGGTLHFNGASLGNAALIIDSLNDLSDAIYDGSSLFIGEGSGISDDGSYNSNTGLGVNALNSNTSGTFNTAIGKNALFFNVSGADNSALGYQSLQNNSTGIRNTAMGNYSLNTNTTGNYNTGLGNYALSANTTGSYNSAIGYALYGNTTGSNNIGIGYFANRFNQGGSNNTIIGFEAGKGTAWHNKSGNVFLGYKAGFYETGNNKLYINNDSSSTPLIWGDFSADSLKFNGNAHVTGNLSIEGNLFYNSFNTNNLNISNWLTVGSNNTTTNLYSILSGSNNLSTALSTATFGANLKSSSYLATVIGRFNDDNLVFGGETWVATEPLFVVGNGTDDVNRSNAVTVLKNGNTFINGNLDINGKAALGATANATGNNSFAMGSNVNATGNGTIFLGDNSAASVQNASNDNRFAARFANGYRFYTTSDLSVGAKMDAGDNSWSAISDSTKKENFLPVSGETILSKISKFNLRSWNYKGQDPLKFRHYGPMAQEFFQAFGEDKFGTIGNDTTIASADFDGINLIAIQALEKRSKRQQADIKDLNIRIRELENYNKELAKINTQFRNQNAKLLEEFDKIKKAIYMQKKQKHNLDLISSK